MTRRPHARAAFILADTRRWQKNWYCGLGSEREARMIDAQWTLREEEQERLNEARRARWNVLFSGTSRGLATTAGRRVIFD